MAANTNPIFVLTPNVGFARVAAANTSRDGTGAVTVAFTAAANGSRVDRITVTASSTGSTATNQAMIARIFISDTGGTNYRIYKEQALASTAASTTVIGATATINILGGLFLASGQKIAVTISAYATNVDQMDFVVEGGDY
jgi:hypothetical protein